MDRYERDCMLQALTVKPYKEEIAKLRAELAEAKKDAERYRWHVKLYSERHGVPESDVVDELDSAIDEALQQYELWRAK